jgi:hypothetical protein
MEEVSIRCETISRAVLEDTGKRFFLDASKNPGLAFHLSKRPNLDFKLIHLVRDPRGFANSCRKHGTYGSSFLWMSALIWKLTNSAALMLKSRLPAEAYLLVKYERLCAHPENVLSEILNFFGVGPADVLSLINEEPHHIVGNNMRLRPFKGLRLDEGWRTNLKPEQRRKCMWLTYGINKELGYRL